MALLKLVALVLLAAFTYECAIQVQRWIALGYRAIVRHFTPQPYSTEVTEGDSEECAVLMSHGAIDTSF